MLEIKEVSKRFGGLIAVDAVSLTVPSGEMHCIIGPNGAGKTTLLSLLTGEQRPTTGEIWLDGERIDGLAQHRVARLGMLRKFQVPGIFPDLTVRQNVAIAVGGTSGLAALLRSGPETATIVDDTLALVRLQEVAETPAGELAHGIVQWLEIGMVLANRPKVIFLDEPTAGMTPAETQQTAGLLQEIAGQTQATVVVVEHDMEFVRRVGQRITVLHKGAVLTQGTLEEVERDPRVREVYLGAEEDSGAA